MISKLFDIRHNSQKKNLKKLKPIIKMSPDKTSTIFTKTNYSSGRNLINNISLTIENKNLHRRIIQKSSIYSITKWEQQYKKSQEYKKRF